MKAAFFRWEGLRMMLVLLSTGKSFLPANTLKAVLASLTLLHSAVRPAEGKDILSEVDREVESSRHCTPLARGQKTFCLCARLDSNRLRREETPERMSSPDCSKNDRVEVVVMP